MQHLDEGTIHAWLDGALSAGEARQAEAHAAGCAACAAAVAEARGLIAASSMIISKLDGVLAASDVRAEAGPSPMHDIAAARAAADSRGRLARRRRLAAPGLRAAAVVLVLAGGVALVQNVTGREELARVVTDASLDAATAREAATAPEAAEAVAQDATAASAEEAPPAAPPPPTVGPAPALPRPEPVVGGMTPTRRAAPQGMVGDVSGVLSGVESGAARNEVSPAAAPTVGAGGGVARAAVRVASPAEAQRADLAQERDLSAAAKAAAESAAPAAQSSPGPVPAAPPAAPATADGAGAAGLARDLRLDTAVARREARRQAEESAVLQQRLAPPADIRGRVAAAVGAAAGGDAGGARRCFVLTLSPWSPQQATIPGAPATRIELSADTGTTGPSKGYRLVRPVPGAFAGSYDHAWYTEVSPSTLVLTWATGSEGIVMRLVRSGDTLTGSARTFGAAGGVERTSDVTGERVDCGDGR